MFKDSQMFDQSLCNWELMRDTDTHRMFEGSKCSKERCLTCFSCIDSLDAQCEWLKTKTINEANIMCARIDDKLIVSPQRNEGCKDLLKTLYGCWSDSNGDKKKNRQVIGVDTRYMLLIQYHSCKNRW